MNFGSSSHSVILLSVYDRRTRAQILESDNLKAYTAENLDQFSSVSCSVMSDSLRPHELQQARPPCPSPTPGVHSNSCPSSRRCHPAISSSVVPFSSCPQSLPASESCPMSPLFEVAKVLKFQLQHHWIDYLNFVPYSFIYEKMVPVGQEHRFWNQTA